MNDQPTKDHATTERPGSLFSRLSPRSARAALQPVAAPQPPPLQVKRRRSALVSWVSNLLTLGLVAAVLAAGATWFVRQQTSSPGPLAESKIVVVRGGLTEIAYELERQGVVSSPMVFMFNAITSGRTTQLKGGEYEFAKAASVIDVLNTLVRGTQVFHSITFPEGITTEQIVAKLRESDLLKGDIRDVPAEGSLLPDTIKFFRDAPRITIIRSMQARQKEVVEEIWKRRAQDLPLKNMQELVTLASIVEKETARADERTRVAAVFINRLNRKMKLQSDPTIVYGLVQGKGTLGRPILKSEIERRTAYNTYVIEGLPPGPIANPGRAALEAVANPSRTNELFFVADGTGGHAFADTLEQHNRNVARWRQIEKQRGEQVVKPVDRVTPPEEPAPAEANPAAPKPPNAPANRRRTDARPPADAPAVAPGAPPPAETLAADPLQRRGNAGRVLVEAVEGKPNDPLRSRGFDLTNPQTVPKLR